MLLMMMMMLMVRSVNVLSARVFGHAFDIYKHTHGIPENMMCDYRIGVVNGLSETKSKPNKKPVAVERLRWPTDPLGRRTRPLSQMKERASVHPSDANPNNHHQQQHPHTHMRLILIIIASFEPPPRTRLTNLLRKLAPTQNATLKTRHRETMWAHQVDDSGHLPPGPVCNYDVEGDDSSAACMSIKNPHTTARIKTDLL